MDIAEFYSARRRIAIISFMIVPSDIAKLMATLIVTSAMLIPLALTGCSSDGKDGDATGACVTNCVQLNGSVTDANGAPIQNANVAVQLRSGVFEGSTNGQGQYAVDFPKDDLPLFFTAYVAKQGYIPKAIPLAFQNGTLLTINGSNNVQTRTTSIEDVVYAKGTGLTHLGDDVFGGTENSQFQLPAHSEFWVDSFNLTPQQRSAYTTLTVSIKAKGLQCSSVVTNVYGSDASGQNVGPVPAQVLGGSPVDGSFGTVTKVFSLVPGIQPGAVYLFIRSDPGNPQTVSTAGPSTVCQNGDRDDFEFIEVVGRLS